MKKRVPSALIARRYQLLLCCAVLLVLQAAAFGQLSNPTIPVTSTEYPTAFYRDPREILCPPIMSCIMNPGGDGGCMGIPCPYPVATPSPIVPSATTVPLIISEFRFRGPGGQNDEFVELYNTSTSPVTVATDDHSAGWSLVASDGIVRFTIPVGTVIPAHAHYLAVNSLGYSLGGYPAGNSGGASGDTVYALDIPDAGGIALFKTANPASFTAANRVDAAGYETAPELYREGAGFPTLAAETFLNIDYSFYRDLTSGAPQDSNNNVADFKGVDTNATNTGAGQHLGAPGPENLSSPIPTGTNEVQVSLLDPAAARDVSPNRVRDTTSDPEHNSPLGTLSIRRTITNVSGHRITRLRFRVVDITTYPSPTDIADLRAITSGPLVATRTDGSNVWVSGTRLETPPEQVSGGGWNSTLSAGEIGLGSPLQPGNSINVQFLLGVQQSGTFRFFIIIESADGGTQGQQISDNFDYMRRLFQLPNVWAEPVEVVSVS